MTTLAAPAPSTARADAQTIGLIGLAHGTSHFFHMLLPPLFPAFIRDFGFSWSQLGLLVTVFFVISGVGQALAGFVVDRIGARPVLFAALGCFVAAALAASVAQGFGGLLLAASLAGLGNSPFHPADFTILNKRVSQARLGHAFSVHGITGNLGWAAAPVWLVALSGWSGSWRTAYLATAAVAACVLVLLVLNRRAIDDRAGTAAARPSLAGAVVPAEHPLAFLRLRSVWLCFSFFFWTTVALSAIQSFASPALGRMYGLPLATTAFVVTGYMVFGAIGMVAGGFVVARAESLERTIAVAMAFSATCMVLVGSGVLPGAAAVGVAAVAGLGVGIAGPSRDMLIKRAAPPGATGRVYGTVYSGLDAGFAIGAPLFGWLLDHAAPGWVFAGSAAALLLGVASAGLVAVGVRQPQPAAA